MAVPDPDTDSKPLSSLDSSDSADFDSMAEFYQLCRELLTTSLALMGLIFVAVWWGYSLNIAGNYLIGASASMLYLRLLARNVERLGREQEKLGKTHLVVFIAVIILASRWQQLHVLPVFLGFLTYKAAILVYTFRTVVLSR